MNKTTNTTTKERQIEFMWHLHGQGFSLREIANIYNVTESKIGHTLERRFKNKTHGRAILS